MNKISIIAAVANNNVIGTGNKMPWHLPNDLQFFQEKTVGNIIVMGRKTYQSIGRPLPERINIVFTSGKICSDVMTVSNLERFFNLLKINYRLWKDKEVFIIGGADIFMLFLSYADTLYLTKINDNFEGDTFFPEVDMEQWSLMSSTKGKRDELNNYDYEHLIYTRNK